ncbi:MAG: hypothetical protein Q8P32_00480 [Candidatus Komeilibacteria bacterium]|nr:hypothetical protein [Candidatus Komeilibacteria bacterium]
MKRLLTSLIVAILIGVATSSNAVVSNAPRPDQLHRAIARDAHGEPPYSPTNVSIDSLTKLVREFNKRQFPDPRKIPIGSTIKIPNERGQYRQWDGKHFEQVRFDVIFARDYVNFGDGHDCFWWSSREFLIGSHDKAKIDPQPVRVPYSGPVDSNLWLWLLLPIIISILVLMGLTVASNYLNREDPGSYPPVLAVGLERLSARSAFNTLTGIQQYDTIFFSPNGPRATQAAWGSLHRSSIYSLRKLRLWMRTADGSDQRVKVKDRQRVLRVTFSDQSVRYFLAECANLAYFSNEVALPYGWIFVAETGPDSSQGRHEVPNVATPQPEAPVAPAAAAPEQTPATEPVQPPLTPLPVVTEQSAQQSTSPLKEPLDLHKILEDPRVTFVHIKKGETEIKIDLKGEAKPAVKIDLKGAEAKQAKAK